MRRDRLVGRVVVAEPVVRAVAPDPPRGRRSCPATPRCSRPTRTRPAARRIRSAPIPGSAATPSTAIAVSSELAPPASSHDASAVLAVEVRARPAPHHRAAVHRIRARARSRSSPRGAPRAGGSRGRRDSSEAERHAVPARGDQGVEVTAVVAQLVVDDVAREAAGHRHRARARRATSNAAAGPARRASLSKTMSRTLRSVWSATSARSRSSLRRRGTVQKSAAPSTNARPSSIPCRTSARSPRQGSRGRARSSSELGPDGEQPVAQFSAGAPAEREEPVVW